MARLMQQSAEIAQAHNDKPHPEHRYSQRLKPRLLRKEAADR